MNTNEIVDLSGTSPQSTFLASQPQPPDPASSVYVQRWSETHADDAQSHTVVGVHIVLAPGHANGLWDAFHTDRAEQKLDPANPRVTVRALRIHCDTLEVRGELCVPEAEVEIHARVLKWATPNAAINTSPLDWSVAKAP
ncbi:MAG TPA: hypothetical protein VK928_11190, partial [Longimicrobiales bacterium]|nr:hypothetical protein [Longimicrobiales bacterium]